MCGDLECYSCGPAQGYGPGTTESHDETVHDVLAEARSKILELFERIRGEYDMGQGDEFWASQIPAVVAKIDQLLGE